MNYIFLDIQRVKLKISVQLSINEMDVQKVVTDARDFKNAVESRIEAKFKKYRDLYIFCAEYLKRGNNCTRIKQEHTLLKKTER